LRLDPDGSGFTKVLFFDKKAQRGGLWGEVSDWFEEHFHQVLELVEVAEEGYLALSPVEAAGLRIPLADTGEGLAQILPVLVALAMARRPNDAPQLVALEQPELHLHPAAEVALGEHLAEIAAAPDPPTLVVETHSENLMLSVQLRIAEGSLPPDAVGAYWVERLEDGRSLARQVEFDDAGRTSGWPEGVFSEDIHLARQMFRLRRERSES
jgi:predicted ATPase